MTARRMAGFTLIELLIVISIMGVLGAIVSPYASQAMRRARADAERMTVERTIERLAFRSFAEGRGVTLEARGAELAWVSDDEPRKVMQLEYLFFNPEQKVFINSGGFADRDYVSITQAGRERRIPLNGWLESK